ncbi:MAG: type I pullulanase [Ruminococcus sp.]|nr:type I pullulanase [Ruminococcus sp.]
MAKKILSTLLCVVLMASSVVIANAAAAPKATGADTDYAIAAQELDDKYGYNGDDLGATYSEDSTTFKVWAPTATSVKVNLYATGSDREEGAENLGSTPLVFDEETGVWSVTLDGDHKNEFYTYTVKAKNVTGKKTTEKETTDVYSVATGVNGRRSQIIDLDETDPEGWDKDTHVVLDKSTDSFVWEVHVKDFSYAPNSGVSDEHRGKYLAFTETGTTLNGEGKIPTMIDYLKELGVTTVQINPFYDFGSVDESGSDSQFNWGYDPMNYNVPEGSYSTNPYDGKVRIKECKQMIQALHNAGLSVVMDVVYNHTYNTETSFEACVPNYYYRMTKTGGFSSGSGCGNDTASERLMFRNFMIQSCMYWVNEYHVDGFRFDLMGLHDVETMNLIREEMDKVDPRLTIWGEGWSMSTTTPSTTCTGETLRLANQKSASYMSERIGFFNDSIRDALKGSVFEMTGRGWLQGSNASYANMTYGILANTKSGTWKALQPSQTVTYTSCHDNQSLWDRLADSEGLTDYWRKRHSTLVAENKLAGGLLNMSQGITFILAGEEMGRSKDNNHNSYNAAATLNMIDWSLAKTNADIVSYYKGMREIRTHFAPLTDNTTSSASKYVLYSGAVDPTTTYAAVWNNTTEGQWKKLAVVANSSKNDTTFTLSDIDGVREWVIIANDQQAGIKKLGEVTGGKFTLPARSMVVAVDKESFESVGLKSEYGSVEVKAYNAITNDVIDSYTITGKVGSNYSVSLPNNLGVEYEISGTKGDLDGTFTEADKTVDIYCGYYAPDSVKVDVNGDGKTNIKDATILQMYLAKKVTLTKEQESLLDFNLDTSIDINDVTMMQKYLADMSVGKGAVTVNYYLTGTENSIKKSVVYEGRVGDTCTVKAASALGYKLNEETLPESTTVTIPYGNRNVNFYYDKAESDVTLHVKHSGDGTYSPALWIWGNSNGADSGNYCQNKTWPGDILTIGEDGWATTGFTAVSTDDSYNVIVSEPNDAGTGVISQSPDCKEFGETEMWIVIDDSKDGVHLNFYDVNPDENEDAKPIYTC